jgi:HlyD family secretion protein
LTDAEDIQILIVEDERLFREMLRRILDAEPGVTVVGTAESGEEAVTQAESLQPDVVMMDVELPGEMDGIDAALVIKAARPDTGIVILSAHKERRYLMSMPIEDSAGWAYLLKQSVPDMSTVIRAIQGTMMGMVVLFYEALGRELEPPGPGTNLGTGEELYNVCSPLGAG